MLRTYLVLHPASGSLEALVSYYQQHRVIEAAVPYGLLLSELAHPLHDPVTVAVGSLWGSATAYQHWLEAPERAGLVTGMQHLLDTTEAITGWVEPVPPVSAVENAGIDFSSVYDDEPLQRRIRVS